MRLGRLALCELAVRLSVEERDALVNVAKAAEAILEAQTGPRWKRLDEALAALGKEPA